MSQVAFNSGDTPVVIDAAGHVIGGGEWGVVADTTEVKRAIADGRLVYAEKPAGDDEIHPQAAEAFAALDDDKPKAGAPAPSEDEDKPAEKPTKQKREG